MILNGADNVILPVDDRQPMVVGNAGAPFSAAVGLFDRRRDPFFDFFNPVRA
jgi:hypothetical protein